jgi:hypothetical protein
MAKSLKNHFAIKLFCLNFCFEQQPIWNYFIETLFGRGSSALGRLNGEEEHGYATA